MDSKQFFQKLLAISNSGINYSKDPYDVERFNEIFDITQEFINSQSNNKNLTLEKEAGYPTPKIDVRALILDKDNKVLLVEDPKTKSWSLPGGFADVGTSPVENVVKEVIEEAGLSVSVSNLIAVYDTNKSNPENSLTVVNFEYSLTPASFITAIASSAFVRILSASSSVTGYSDKYLSILTLSADVIPYACPFSYNLSANSADVVA